MQGEQAVASFLDENFYGLIKSASFEREPKEGLQHAGVDLKCHRDREVLYIDEKAALYYMDRDIPTFAFELSFLNRFEDVRVGWFLNDALKTTHYLLIWITTNRPPEKGKKHTIKPSSLHKKDIKKLECLFLSRDELKKRLEENGLSSVVLKEKANSLRANGKEGREYITGQSLFYYFASSPKKYKEAPINLIIKKELLKDVPGTRHYEVLVGKYRCLDRFSQKGESKDFP